jgi:hypothetical protein
MAPSEVEESRCETFSYDHGILRLRYATLHFAQNDRCTTCYFKSANNVGCVS